MSIRLHLYHLLHIVSYRAGHDTIVGYLIHELISSSRFSVLRGQDAA
jgi:hypothetical protein